MLCEPFLPVFLVPFGINKLEFQPVWIEEERSVVPIIILYAIGWRILDFAEPLFFQRSQYCIVQTVNIRTIRSTESDMVMTTNSSSFLLFVRIVSMSLNDANFVGCSFKPTLPIFKRPFSFVGKLNSPVSKVWKNVPASSEERGRSSLPCFRPQSNRLRQT